MKAIFIKYIIFLLLSIIIPQNKLLFSASSVQGKTINGTKVEIFKDNVEIIDGEIQLLANQAMHFKDQQKVIINDNVIMINKGDSLFCDKLILSQNINNNVYKARGSIIFKQVERTLVCDSLTYWKQIDNIKAESNVEINEIDRTIKSDSAYIDYENSLIKTINIMSSASIVNTRYGKIDSSSNRQPVQDNIRGNHIILNFDNNEKINDMKVINMAEAQFYAIRDSIIKGQNTVSGDTILINFNLNDSNIEDMTITGGAKGTFNPEKTNNDIQSSVIYFADFIFYNLADESSLLTRNAKIEYDNNILEGDEIFSNWRSNMIESAYTNNIYPMITKGQSEPMVGDYMKFDLTTKKGYIEKGRSLVDMGIFKGENFMQKNDDELYIHSSSFSSCNLEHPHYYFASKKMKVINNDKIISKPMTVFIQDFPIAYVPFAIFPNSEKKRQSGLIMPSFGHSSNRGTYIRDFGFYVAPNDFMDLDFLIDFYDLKYIEFKSNLRYNKMYGKNWYNYKYNGSLQIKKYRIDLLDEINDFNYLSDSDSTNSQAIIYFKHNQSFDPTQKVIIDYEYKSDRNVENEIDIQEILNQNLVSNFSYSKSWQNGSSLIIGYNEFKKLDIPEIDDFNNQSINYKHYSGGITYNMPSKKIFGNGDKWYHDIYLSYNMIYKSNRKDYYKVLSNNQSSIVDSSYQTIGGLRNYINISIATKMPGKFEWLNVNPNFNYYDDWVFEHIDSNQNIKNDFQRRSIWNVGINFNTNLQGIFNIDSKNIQALKHNIKPWTNISYQSDFQDNENDIDFFQNTFMGGNPNGYFYCNFGIENDFQIKDKKQKIWDIVSWDIRSGYNWKNKRLSDIASLIVLSGPPNGQEYLSFSMVHTLYDSSGNFLDITKGQSPKLKSLSLNISRTFDFNLSGESFYPNINNNYDKIWDSSLGLTLTADYGIQNKWTFSKFLKSSTNVYVTQKWKIKVNADFNLDVMEISRLGFKFQRPLHCWEFEFDLNPMGINKGFLFRIAIIEPSLNEINIRQSNRRNFY